MKHKLKYLLAVLSLISLNAAAQNDVDALRYSQTSLAGTARYTSMAGAFSALGGDFSVLATNPAGIAIYKRSEFSMSPSFYKEKSESDYLGKTTADNKYNFNFGNAGIIFTYRLTHNDSSRGWKNWNFGLGYNRMNNFHAASTYEGTNNNNSLLDSYLERVNNGNGTYYSDVTNNFPFDAGLAYQTYLIDTVGGDPYHYQSAIQSYGETQRRSVESKGSMGEFDLSFGANYSNRFYIGGTIGIASLRYVETSTYEEIDAQDMNGNFKSFRLNNDLKTTGTGINFKLGMIYRANDFVRIGLAVHTPTFYSMRDEYSGSMNSEFDDGSSYTYNSPSGSFDYELTTPMKAIAGIGFVIGKMGLISADYEFIDYSEAKLNSGDYKFFDENTAIRTKYTAAGNLRIGTEWRYDTYSFRAGYAMYASPFATGQGVSGADQERSVFSLGIGIRDVDYFLDLAYAFSTGKSFYLPYNLSTEQVPGATTEMQTNNITLTFGVKF
jgi:hypothetical protein